MVHLRAQSPQVSTTTDVFLPAKIQIIARLGSINPRHAAAARCAKRVLNQPHGIVLGSSFLCARCSYPAKQQGQRGMNGHGGAVEQSLPFN